MLQYLELVPFFLTAILPILKIPIPHIPQNYLSFLSYYYSNLMTLFFMKFWNFG